MEYKLQYMDLALQDMAGIKEYLSGFYPDTWTRFWEKVMDKTALLASSPYMCEAYQPNPNYRRLIVENYLVFYKVNDSEKTIYIHRVLHGTRNIQQYLDF